MFYHIEFPDPAQLAAIINRRFGVDNDFSPQQLRGELAHFQQIRDAALQHFQDIRNARNLRKKPATAELLAWLQILLALDLDVSDVNQLTPPQLESLALSYSVLAKSREDMAALKKVFM